MPIYGCATHQKEYLLVHEYLPNGTLAAELQGKALERGILPWPTRLDIAVDTASALDYLHYNGIIHRNVKSSNIIFDRNFCAKVANFHLSRKLPEGDPAYETHVTGDIIGTCGYVDPEYVLKGLLSMKNDVYSFGVVLCELVSSMLAEHWIWNEEDSLATLLSKNFENQALEELLDPRLGFQSDPKIKQMMTATAELAFQCLQCPQELRPNMEQVLQTLNGIKQGRYETNPYETNLTKGIRPLIFLSLFLSHVFPPCMCFGVNRLGAINYCLVTIHVSQLSQSSTMLNLKKLLTILTLALEREGLAESTMVRSYCFLQISDKINNCTFFVCVKFISVSFSVKRLFHKKPVSVLCNNQ